MNCKQVAVWDDAEGVSVLFYLCFFFLKKLAMRNLGSSTKILVCFQQCFYWNAMSCLSGHSKTVFS